MAEHRADLYQRGYRWLLACVVLSLGLLLAAGSLTSYAYWTDDATVTGTTFTTGTLDLVVNGDIDDAVSFTSMNIANMAPQNTTAGVLKIANTGTVALKYTVTTSATNTDGKNLAGALTVRVTGAASVTGTSPAATCSGTVLTGTASTFTANLVTTGRVLPAGGSETLCVQAGLPATASGSLQGATTAVTFGVQATSDLS